MELGYGSDLDLVFLHDSSGEIQQTPGERPLDNVVFFLRLGQRIVHLLTMHSAAGRLYEVDMRLRPNGKGGFLMTGIDAFERYQHQDAWTWEHQALLRARAVAGDADLRRRFEEARRRVLCNAVHRDTLRKDVMEMRLADAPRAVAVRRRTVRHQAGRGRHRRHRIPGAVLGAFGGARTSGTRDLQRQYPPARGAGAVGVLDAATAQWLKEAYIGYRTVLHHLSLEGGQRVVAAGPHAQTRARVQEIWRQAFDTADI